nr:Endoglin CD105 antigen domain containing protein [Haemonchus contortus]
MRHVICYDPPKLPGYVGQKQVPYYTRPEDFKIPDYRPAKPNAFQPNFQPGFQPNFRPNIQPNPQQTNFRPFFIPNQFIPQQFIPQQFRPLNQGNNFVGQPPFNPNYRTGPQYPGNRVVYPPNQPAFPVVNNGRNQWFVPQSAFSYLEGSGPVPPQGIYGPTTTSYVTAPQVPSVNPQNYQGTLPTQPSANPERITTPTIHRPLTDMVPDRTTKETEETEEAEETEETTPEYNEEIYDHSEQFVEATTKTVQQTKVSSTVATYVPKPISTQGYQPPGHLPEDFSKHIDVSFLKPTPTTCVGPLCGVDVDKVSLYKPESAEAGHRPTLLISNAAKGDAARLGYIPPPPKPVSEFGPLPPEYNYSRPYPGYRPVPTKGPHVFMPPQNFPAPSPSSQIPRVPAYETTNQPSYSPTAKTIPTKAPPELPVEVPTATVRYVTSERTTGVHYTPFPLETTQRHSETLPPVTTTQPTYTDITIAVPEVPNPYESETTLPPWSPTYKTVPTRAPATVGTTAPRVSFEAPTTTAPHYESSRTTYVSVETTPQYTRPPTSTGQTSQATFPSPSELPSTPTRVPITSSSEIPTYKTTPSRETLSTRPRESLTSIFGETPTSPRESLTSSSGTPSTVYPETPTTPSRETLSTRPKESQTSTSGETPTSPRESLTSSPGAPSTTSFQESPATPARETTTPPFGGTHTTPSSQFTPTEVPEETTPSRPLATPFRGYSTDVNVNLTSSTVKSNVPNRVRGKVHVICKEDGIEFSATTLFPFTGQIFANERKRVSSCVYNLVDSVRPMVFLPFADCGVKNAGDQKDNRAQYHMQVVMVIQQNDGTSTVQSFMAQCVHQKIHYNKQTLPRRIEEALEELRLVATKLEQKAPLPQVEMKIVVDEHHQIGPEVSEVDIGMPLAVQWKLIPESDAYGFHVKNCIVRDDISGIEHKMIDELGCSTDLSIFAHPHYDTYHDTASSHLWAFKVPDHTRLRIRCDVAICSDIPSSTANISSCASIPSPPFCPDLITSPTNSILYDAEGAFLKRRRQAGEGETQTVRAALCTGDRCDSPALGLDKRCFDLYWVTASTGFSFATLIAAISIHVGVKMRIARQ